MKRMLVVMVLCGAVALAGSAVAQGPGRPGGFGKKKGPPGASGSEGIRRIESELAQIHQQLNRIEAALKTSHGHAAKGFGGHGKKGGWHKGWAKKGFHGGPGGFAHKGHWGKGWEKKGFGPGAKAFAYKGGWGKGGEKKGFDGGWGKGGEKKGFGPPHGKKDGPKGFDKKKAFAPPGSSRSSSGSVQQRLEQIQEEIGELRRVLKKK